MQLFSFILRILIRTVFLDWDDEPLEDEDLLASSDAGIGLSSSSSSALLLREGEEEEDDCPIERDARLRALVASERSHARSAEKAFSDASDSSSSSDVDAEDEDGEGEETEETDGLCQGKVTQSCLSHLKKREE